MNDSETLRHGTAAQPLRYYPYMMQLQKFSRLLPLAAVLAVTGCGRAEFAFNNASTFGQTNPPVCLPGGGTGTSKNGLAGTIKYLTTAEATAARPTKIDDILNRGHDAGVQLLLNDLDVPTVKFSQGFYDPATGAALRTASGDVLIEWFAIDMYSNLTLGDTDTDGLYQLALISDDGAVLNINESATTAGTTLVNNDGEHPTLMGCATNAIHLTKGVPLPIHVKYYQGPREHIALTLVWRKVAATSTPKDVACGTGGNDYFWNSNVTPSAPTSKFTDLLCRGWKVPTAKNFVLPTGVTNTCGI